MTSLFKDSFDQLEISRQRVRSLIEKQSELEAKILGFKKEHLQYHQSESMREQMKKTEKTQSRLLEDIYSQLEDLSDLLVHGLSTKGAWPYITSVKVGKKHLKHLLQESFYVLFPKELMTRAFQS